ncbi:MAG: hypothetical protein GY759_04275 [Chloroflexi bacterium]|nr:hypothetical protein [Chloroflexota bacterium]
MLSGDIDQDDTTDAMHVTTGSGTNATAVLEGFTITAGLTKTGSNFLNYRGGGMINDGGSPTLANVSFSGNSGAAGGGMFNNDNSSPTLTNVSFSGNSAEAGGGMYSYYNSSPILTNVSFSGNSAYGRGGDVQLLQ